MASTKSSYRNSKESARAAKLLREESGLDSFEVFGSGLSYVFKMSYLGSGAVHSKDGSSENMQQGVADAVAMIKQAKKAPLKVNVAMSMKEVGIVHVPQYAVVQHAPLSGVALCLNSGSECFLVTVNMQIGVAFVHLLLAKNKKEADELPKALTNLISEAKRTGEFDASVTENKFKGLRLLGSFDALFIGSIDVEKEKGHSVCVVAFGEVQKSNKKNKDYNPRTVFLLAVTDGLRIYDALTNEEHHISFIKSISFVTVLEEGSSQEVFAYIEHDDRLAVSTCYFYRCPKGIPDTICRIVGSANDQSLIDQEQKSGNPLQPEDDDPVVPVEGPLKQFELARDVLEVVKELGSGQFGMVYLINHTISSTAPSDEHAGYGFDSEPKAEPEPEPEPEVKTRAAKLLRPACAKNEQEEFRREAEIMVDLKHPQVVDLIGVCMSQRPWIVCLELMLYGDLKKVLKASKSKKLKYALVEQLNFAHQISSGMQFIAEKGYVHMDLAARNVLLHENNLLKIADFGCAHHVDSESKQYRLTSTLRLPVRWMAPETLSKPPIFFSQFTDIYSFGVLLWELVTYGLLPFKDLDSRAARDAIVAKATLERPFGLEYIPRCEDIFWEWMTKCWAFEVKDRPTFSTVTAAFLVARQTAEAETPPRDIGAEMNRLLSENVKRMSRRKSVARKASVIRKEDSEVPKSQEPSEVPKSQEDSEIPKSSEGPQPTEIATNSE